MTVVVLARGVLEGFTADRNCAGRGASNAEGSLIPKRLSIDAPPERTLPFASVSTILCGVLAGTQTETGAPDWLARRPAEFKTIGCAFAVAPVESVKDCCGVDTEPATNTFTRPPASGTPKFESCCTRMPIGER